MKRLLIIMLILLAVGVASANIIKIKTDMQFSKPNIRIWQWNLWSQGQGGDYVELGQNEFFYNETLREISVTEGMLYRVKIVGEPMINIGYCEINESGIDMRYTDYYVIEKWFFRFPVDPGTPITQ